MRKSVCVIGCGPSGLTAIKELKAEGHEVECFESAPSLGGVFSGRGVASNKVYENLRLTISSYYMAFSDFMPTDHVNTRFWTGEEYLEYCKQYADHFKILDPERVHFNSRVTAVRREGEVWRVDVDMAGKAISKTYDAVAVCCGTHQHEGVKTMPGQEVFKGQIIHASTYLDASGFKGKRVLVIGMGETAADVTREVSEVASEPHLLLRSNPFMIPRLLPTGAPGDSGTCRLRYMQSEDSFLIWALVLVYSLFLYVLERLGVYKCNWTEYPDVVDAMGQPNKGSYMDFRTPRTEAVVKQMQQWHT